MERIPFARCREFLNYHPVPKWLSIVCSIATSVLFVALLILLAFFIDLLVYSGEIVSYHQLPEGERLRFLGEIILPDDLPKEARDARVKEIEDELPTLGFDRTAVQSWAKSEPTENWSAREPAVLWWAMIARHLEVRVGTAAADRLRAEINASIERNGGVEVALYQSLRDFGLLSLVVRHRQGFDSWFLGGFSKRNEWMWAYGTTVYLLVLFALALGIAIARLVLIFFANYLAAFTVIEAVTRLRRALYHHTNRLGILAVRALGPSEAVSISTRHLEAVHEGLYQWLTVYFRASVKFGLLLAFTLVVNSWLALALLLFAVLVWLIGGQIAVHFRKQGRAADASSADHLALIQESLMLMRLVKIYLMEAFNQTRIERQLGGYARAQLVRYRAEAIYRPVFYFLGLAAALVLLLVAGYVMVLGRFGVTSTLVLAVAIFSLYWPTFEFLEARRAVRHAGMSAKVLFAFLDRQGGVGQAIEATVIPPMTKALQFDNVSLREPGTDRTLLENISFTIRAGQRIAIVGPDEMEKHALVYLLPRFLDPSHGEIRIDGKNLRWVTLDSLRAQIAMVLQRNLVFNDTVANNIGCGDAAYSRQRIMEAAKLAHAHQFISKLPKAYETVVGDMGHPLKLGERFRVALARALLREPAILVIEEPATPLDDGTKAMIDDTIQRVLAGRTVIFLPHRLTTMRACDQVFLLYRGGIAATGEHRELLANSDLYRHLQYIEFNEFAGLAPPAASEADA